MIPLSVLHRPTAAMLAVLVALLAGCGSTPKEPESQWSSERLYSEAKEEASTGNYERASKLYERLEGRASGTALVGCNLMKRSRVESACALSLFL